MAGLGRVGVAFGYSPAERGALEDGGFMSVSNTKVSTGRRVFLRVAAGSIAALLAGAASGASYAGKPEEDYVQRVARDVLAAANSGAGNGALKRKFNNILSQYVDTRNLAVISVGKFWKQMPAGRKAEYHQLVQRYISAFFVYYVDDFRGSSLNIKSVSKQGKFTTIASEIVSKKSGSEPVRWRLVPSGGGYRIHDVNVRGIWLSLSLQDRFTDILKSSKGDFEPLFAELKSAETWSP
jgi:ABC-type transporter MlaC component